MQSGGRLGWPSQGNGRTLHASYQNAQTSSPSASLSSAQPSTVGVEQPDLQDPQARGWALPSSCIFPEDQSLEPPLGRAALARGHPDCHGEDVASAASWLPLAGTEGGVYITML